MNNYSNYQELANVIIKQAAEDYRNKEKMRYEVERFFLSEWFKILTNLSGEKLLKMLKDELKSGQR